MPYRIRRKDDGVEPALRRIAVEQIDRAIAAIDRGEDRRETVHDVRKRLKKLRSLLRLVGGAFRGRGPENDAFRQAARGLSAQRDAEVMVATYDALLDAHPELDRRPFRQLRRRLTLDLRGAEDQGAAERGLADARAALETARDRAVGWRLKAEGFDAVRDGLGKTYGRARKAMRAAEKAPTGESMHEWRKRAKRHWHHLRLLRDLWRGPLDARAREADALADLLGHHHDLHVLSETLRARADRFGEATDLDAFLGLAAARRDALAAEAFEIGRRLFAEKPDAFLDRFGRYWTASRAETRAPAPARAA